MKQIKNAMLVLASGLLTTFAIVSCSKNDDGGTPPPATNPTITGINPASGAVGTAVTITGTNLAGGSVKFGTTAATVTSAVAGSIATSVPAGLAAGPVVITVTVGTKTVTTNFTVTTAGPITSFGYTASNQVAADSLIAYWPFTAANTTKELKTNTTASKVVGTAFTAADGPFGTYANFTDGYLIYPKIAPLNTNEALEQYTISMWVKIAASNATKYPATGGRYSSLFQVSSMQVGDLYGSAALTLHTNEAHGTDTFAFGSVLRQIDNRTITYNGATGTDHLDDSSRANAKVEGAGTGTKWFHVVQTFGGYLPNPRPLATYINGVLVHEQKYYNLIGDGENFGIRPGGTDPSTGDVLVSIGTFRFAEDFGNSTVWHGANSIPNAADKIYWAHGITGGISDLRVFKAPITDNQVKALYELGSHGQ